MDQRAGTDDIAAHGGLPSMSDTQGMVTSRAGAGAATEAAWWRPPDGRRMLQLALATIWLLDGVLQLQPLMFTPGSQGLSGMLGHMASGNPHVVARTITWNASIIDHHAVATNSAFALVQILIGFGIAWRPTIKTALAASIVWSLGVWWFGEGLGGVLHGAGTPIGGGPGAALFYAVLALLLWPSDKVATDAPFVAARAVGGSVARAIWVVVWAAMGILAVVGAGRSPQGIRDLISAYSGQPGWLATIDRHAGSLLAQQGLVIAAIVAVVCIVVALGVFLPAAAARATLVVAIATAAVIWVVGENLGGVLAGGATDPNSGPLLILLALAYWPAHLRPVTDPRPAARTSRVEVA